MPKKTKKGADDFFESDMMESIIEGKDDEEPNIDELEIAIPEKKEKKKGGKKTEPAKPNGNTKEESKEDEDAEVEEETETKPKASKSKAKAGKAAKATAKASAAPKSAKASAKASAPPADQPDDEESKQEPEEVEAKGGKKKGGKATAAPKKKGISSAVADLLRKQREEEERRLKEEEERRIKEEEEERLREEEEEKQRIEEERIREEKKKERKIKEKERKAKEEALRMEEKRNALLQKYGVAGAPGPSKPTFKKPERKKNIKKEEPEPTPEPVVEEKKEVEPAVEEEDSWETRDTWEDAENEEDILQEKPKEPEKEPEPVKQEPAPTPAPAVKSESDNNNVHPEAENPDHLRSPICCVLGHVDTGKTKLLDYLRRSNVQEGEAGGITQQIGATFFPMDKIKEKTSKMNEARFDVKVPGLLMIDTPGHASFTNLRSRGSGLCDIAILVVDIMHGLEPQTIESINLLKMKKTPFIVALNKVDRLFGWKTYKDMPFRQALALQDKNTQLEFEQRTKETMTYFAEQGLNATLYYENKDYRKYVSLVPTSAMNGEGIPDLLMLLVQLTQRLMAERLLYLSKLQCTVLEVKMIEGLGTTIDVILVNGVLHEGDTIVVCGLNGPIVTTIRALLTPQPLKEMRVKGSYVHHKTIRAAMGIKISAADLDKAVAGSSLIVANPKTDDMEALKKEVMQDLNSLLAKVSKSDHGVYVQASTLGSLEALLEFLKSSKIPVSGINIGPISKKDVVKASVMLEHKKEYAVILAFDVKAHRDAVDLADDMGIQIFKADIIYHLFDQFTMYMKRIEDAKIEATKQDAVFPVRLKIVPECIFHAKDPIVVGVEILEGKLRIGTPICVPSREFAELGRVTSIQNNKKEVNEATKGSSVAIKIELPEHAKSVTFGRTFFLEDELVSKISRTSIDVMKAHYASELTKEDVMLLGKLKALFGIK